MDEKGNSASTMFSDHVMAKDVKGVDRKLGLVTLNDMALIEQEYGEKRDEKINAYARKYFRNDLGKRDYVAANQYVATATASLPTQEDALRYVFSTKGMELVLWLCLKKFDEGLRREDVLELFQPQQGVQLVADVLKASGFSEEVAETGEENPPNDYPAPTSVAS